MRKCSKCKIGKHESEYGIKRSRIDGLQPWCRECNRERSKKYYKENREKHKKVAAIRRKVTKEITGIEYCKFLLKNPCTDCNQKNILVLEPDHIFDKSFNVSAMVRGGYPWKTVLKELEKCEIVCRNCHFIREQKRSGSYRIKFLASIGQLDRPEAF